MSSDDVDAVAIFRPRSVDALTPFLDLDEAEESEGLYAEPLDDGSFLVFTFQPYAAFEQSEDAALEWLALFGDALPEVHEDARGLLFFPDSLEPEGRTYDAVVGEVEEHGVWVGAAMPTTSFELGMMVEGMQRHIIDALEAQLGDPVGDADDDEEPEK
jgi:hypothetical protein